MYDQAFCLSILGEGRSLYATSTDYYAQLFNLVMSRMFIQCKDDLNRAKTADAFTSAKLLYERTSDERIKPTDEYNASRRDMATEMIQYLKQECAARDIPIREIFE